MKRIFFVLALMAAGTALRAQSLGGEYRLKRIVPVEGRQGIAAVCGLPKPCPLERQGQKLLLMENVQDPGNVGTILRTLDAAGFDGCILTPGCEIGRAHV